MVDNRIGTPKRSKAERDSRMTRRKNTQVKEAVLHGFKAPPRREHKFPFSRILQQPRARKTGLVVFALILSGGIIALLWQMSGQGEMNLLKQRFFGQIQLSSGTYAARNISDLNQLSWDNGLEIITALDKMNHALRSYEAAMDDPHTNHNQLIQNRADVKRAINDLRVLLKDRKAIEQTAQNMDSTKLYTPVYKQYLSETMDKLTELKLATKDMDNLVQR